MNKDYKTDKQMDKELRRDDKGDKKVDGHCITEKKNVTCTEKTHC